MSGQRPWFVRRRPYGKTSTELVWTGLTLLLLLLLAWFAGQWWSAVVAVGTFVTVGVVIVTTNNWHARHSFGVSPGKAARQPGNVQS